MTEQYNNPEDLNKRIQDAVKSSISLEQLSAAMKDVLGEKHKGKITELKFEIDKEYWEGVVRDSWDGNIYSYSF